MISREFLTEGVHDPAIFKAIFIIGGPGSGKTFVGEEQLGLSSQGYVKINSDIPFEYFLEKHGLSFKMPPEEQAKRDILRQRAKSLTDRKTFMAVDGRLGLAFDTTGRNYDKIVTLKNNLEKLGYDTYLLIVNATLENAIKRNAERKRSIPVQELLAIRKDVESNLGPYVLLFDKNVSIIDEYSKVPLINQIDMARKKINKFTQMSPKSEAAKEWIKHQSSSKNEV